MQQSTPAGSPIGVHVPELWQAEVSAATELGLIDQPIDDVSTLYTNEFVAGVYDDAGELIWP